MGKRRLNGEKRERENGEIKKSEAGRGFSLAPARFISPLPIPRPTGKTKETSAEELGLVQHNKQHHMKVLLSSFQFNGQT